MGGTFSKCFTGTPLPPTEETTKTLEQLFEQQVERRDSWIVTVVCEENRGSGFGHAFLLFKRPDDSESAVDLSAFRCDLSRSQANSVTVKRLGFSTAKITLEEVADSYTYPRCLKPIPLTSEQAERIFGRIDSDIRKQESGTPILYNPAGFHESFESSFGNVEHHNCLSYCMDVLRELNINVGNENDWFKIPRRTIPRTPQYSETED